MRRPLLIGLAFSHAAVCGAGFAVRQAVSSPVSTPTATSEPAATGTHVARIALLDDEGRERSWGLLSWAEPSDGGEQPLLWALWTASPRDTGLEQLPPLGESTWGIGTATRDGDRLVFRPYTATDTPIFTIALDADAPGVTWPNKPIEAAWSYEFTWAGDPEIHGPAVISLLSPDGHRQSFRVQTGSTE